MQRTSPAKGDEDKMARIIATLYRDQAHGADHVCVGNLHDAMGRLQGVESQGLATLLHDGRTAGVRVKGDFPTEKKRRVEPAEHQIGVGNGWCGAALAVTDRPGYRPGATWSHAQCPTGIDPRFTASPCPNLDQVDHRRAHRIATASPLPQRRDGLPADLELCRQL